MSAGLHDERREVVRDEAGWTRLWAQIHETCPAPGDVVTLALTQPVEVVRLGRLPPAIIGAAASPLPGQEELPWSRPRPR